MSYLFVTLTYFPFGIAIFKQKVELEKRKIEKIYCFKDSYSVCSFNCPFLANLHRFKEQNFNDEYIDEIIF